MNPGQADSIKECMKREKIASLFWAVAETTTLVNLWGDISMQYQLDSARREQTNFSAFAAGSCCIGLHTDSPLP